MAELSKRVRKQARELIRMAYARELNYHFYKLAQKFDGWQKNTIDCWELNDWIHQYHDGVSRDLYKIYNYTQDEIFLISRAIAHGFLQKDELSKEVLELSNVIASNLQINENNEGYEGGVKDNE